MADLAETSAPARPDAGGGPDRSTLRLGLIVGGIFVALLAGFGLGRLNGGNSGQSPAAAGPPTADHTHAPGTGPHEHPSGAATTAAVGGLAVSDGGYTLVPQATTFTPGRPADLRFTIQGPGRQPVTTFAVVHEKPLHLIVARRDLSGFQHLHPTMAPDGTWSVPLTLPEPGVWRAFADFTVNQAAGQPRATTLGVDLIAAGAYAPRPLPAAATETTVDGFTVSYAGTPSIGATQPLTFSVARDGAPAALEPYLGASGHLVTLRDGDLAYLHTHPDAVSAPGLVKFWLAAPSPGRYRMYLDFQVGGVVRTAEFTVDVD